VLSDWSGDGKGQILRTEVSELSGMKHLNLVKNLISREDRKTILLVLKEEDSCLPKIVAARFTHPHI
jgi:hypothetical protein